MPMERFYSTEDADSEGVEGKYYVWSLAEVTEVLGAERAKTFCYVYDVTERATGKMHNILNLPQPIDQAAKLLGRDEGELRSRAGGQPRRAPGRARQTRAAGQGHEGPGFLERPDDRRPGRRRPRSRDERYLEAAGRAAGFILDRMRRDDGRLLHTYKDGQAKLDAYLDDYADLIDGLTRLYEATGEPRWIESALELAAIMIDEFADAEQGGFFFTGHRHEALIARQKDVHDNATPSGNGMAATAPDPPGRLDRPRRPDRRPAERRSSRFRSCSSASRPRPDRA